MEDELALLTQNERDLLLKAPVFVSALAASTDGVLDKKEKAGAIELSHLRTFTADEELQSYYSEVERIFAVTLSKVLDRYDLSNESDQKAIREKLEEVNRITNQMEESLALKLKKSLNSYAEHVNEIHKDSVLFNLLFPVELFEKTEAQKKILKGKSRIFN